MKSTTRSLNWVLGTVKNEKCTSSHVYGVTTINITFNGEPGQGKIGTSVTKNSCSDSAGCQLATQYLPPGVLSQECKILYIKTSLFCIIACLSLFFSLETNIHLSYEKYLGMIKLMGI